MDNKFILLDLDGVLITAKSWETMEFGDDGLYDFKYEARKNLEWLLKESHAKIILITNHAKKYDHETWEFVFWSRCGYEGEIILFDDFEYPNESKDLKIERWSVGYGYGVNYVILDDDNFLNNLPNHIKERWIQPFSMIGLTDENVKKALENIKLIK